MAEVASARLAGVDVVVADAVPLPYPDDAFERIFTSHFYGHLLPGERERFISETRRVAGELIVVDSALRPGTEADQWQERTLSDGSQHRVYKRFFAAEELLEELGGGEILMDGDWFVAVRSPRGEPQLN
jgi:hypothetical protein